MQFTAMKGCVPMVLLVFVQHVPFEWACWST